ncbi:cache domain-containing protein [Halomicronema sp. CCY15110]|uniref:cache domain-containing protein n=1 Tax=Halomicronema sp. CCY15110 TaxID=2767773 RepID=UPI0019510D73|nr:cache domain-containing protein [Halomicronema sp. CCY15110]
MTRIAALLSKRRPSLGLKATLVSAMLLTVTATAAMVYVPWAWMSRRNIQTIVDQTNKEIAVGTSKEVERLFSNAESAQQFIEAGLNRNLLDLSDEENREFFFLNVLAASPAFTWVQYGDANGDFLGAQRTANGELHFHNRDWDPDTETTQSNVNSYAIQDAVLTPLERKSFEMNPSYYAPDRPWYQGAAAAPDQRSWTVYVYRSSGTPGVDLTKAIKADGELLGVIGVGIELNQLSDYLEQLQGDRPGETFIVNSQGELIASTDKAEVTPDQTAGDTDAQLTQLTEVQNPLLQYASDTLQAEEFDLSNLEAWQRFVFKESDTGEIYHIALTPMGQLDWMVGTVIPESTYTAAINRNKRRLLAGVVIFTGGIAIVAVMLAERLIARPILGIAKAAADIEADNFNPDQLGETSDRQDEIGQLARIFRKMAIQVHQREEKLRLQVQNLRVEIDETKRSQQVKEIVDTDFFRDLAVKAKALRNRDRP